MTGDPNRCDEDLNPHAEGWLEASLVLSFRSFQFVRIAVDPDLGASRQTPIAQGEMVISVDWGAVELSQWGVDQDLDITIQYGNGAGCHPPIAPQAIRQATGVVESSDASRQLNLMFVPGTVFRIHGNAAIGGALQPVDLSCRNAGQTGDGKSNFITASPIDNGDGTLGMFLAIRMPGPPLPLLGQGQ